MATVAGSAGDHDALEAAVARCTDDLGGLDILVNNAATNPTFGPMIETEPAAVRKVLEVNVEGALLLTQLAWSARMSEHGGSVVNVASLGGIRPSPFIGIYNASKAALLHLTRQLALELAPAVRVERGRPRARQDPLRPCALGTRRGGFRRAPPSAPDRRARRRRRGGALPRLRRGRVDHRRHARDRRRDVAGLRGERPRAGVSRPAASGPMELSRVPTASRARGS